MTGSAFLQVTGASGRSSASIGSPTDHFVGDTNVGITNDITGTAHRQSGLVG
jgi:hypothetical protein